MSIDYTVENFPTVSEWLMSKAETVALLKSFSKTQHTTKTVTDLPQQPLDGLPWDIYDIPRGCILPVLVIWFSVLGHHKDNFVVLI